VYVFHAGDVRAQVHVAGDTLVGEVKLIARVPDVAAGAANGEIPAGFSGAARRGWRADVSVRPRRGEALRQRRRGRTGEHGKADRQTDDEPGLFHGHVYTS
jgi:hypothetical protein